MGLMSIRIPGELWHCTWEADVALKVHLVYFKDRHFWALTMTMLFLVPMLLRVYTLTFIGNLLIRWITLIVHLLLKQFLVDILYTFFSL